MLDGCFQRTPSGAAAGVVTVKTEGDAGYYAQQALDVLRRGGGAQGGYGIAQTLLGQGDDVHVAFHHQDVLQLLVVLTRFVQAIKFLALVEHRGFR